MKPAAFLRRLFGNPKLEGLSIVIWDRQTKKSASFRLPEGLDAAGEEALARCDSRDVYVGVCPYVHGYAENQRGVEQDAGALVGFWADIDIFSEAHAAKNLPPDREAALDLVYSAKHRPDIVIFSGYGVQAWWLLAEPWLLKTAEDRRQARRYTDGWNAYLLGLAKARDWTVDSVSDLARVLRVPGTKNHKRDTPISVEVI